MNSLLELLEMANKALGPFSQLMEEFVKKAGLNPAEVVMHKGVPLMMDDKQPCRVLSVAPLKGHKRCLEKVTNEYDGNWSQLVDVVRCSIVVQTEAALESVARAMSASNDPRYSLVRLKNRFKEPLFNGYRDALYSLSVRAVGVWHVCEVQLHLAAVIFHKHESHVYYEFFRTYFRGNVEAANSRMKLLEAMGSSEGGVDAMVLGVLRGTDTGHLEAFAELAGAGMMGEYRLLVAVERRRLELAPKEHQMDAQSRLADALSRVGQYGEAEPLYRACLAVRKETLGDKHPDTLASMNNLAILLKSTGKIDEAEQLFRASRK